MKRHLYESDWERGEPVNEQGKQAHTFHARRRTDPEGVFNYILKAPKNQKSVELRGRMHVEAAALQTLDISGVARLAATNAGDFKEDVELYLIAEKVHGCDLDEFVASGIRDVSSAATTILFVLNTLSYCHQRDVIHRDIKPCHVILRGHHFSNPVLIDFGLAFKEDVDRGEADTSTEHGVGNRFILMPEQLHPEKGQDKRDYRSDITQVVGLYFFLITGKYPGIIVDKDQTKPHQRLDLDQVIVGANERRRAVIRRIFDAGFEWETGKRWQSIADLEKLFGKITEDQPDEVTFLERARSIKLRLDERPEVIAKKQLDKLSEPVVAHFHHLVNAMGHELGEYAATEMLNSHRDSKALTFDMRIRTTAKHNGKVRDGLFRLAITTRYELHIVVAGEHLFEAVLASSPERVRIVRAMNAFDPSAQDAIHEALEVFLLEEAERAAQFPTDVGSMN